jgi:hypothetical protein
MLAKNMTSVSSVTLVLRERQRKILNFKQPPQITVRVLLVFSLTRLYHFENLEPIDVSGSQDTLVRRREAAGRGDPGCHC